MWSVWPFTGGRECKEAHTWIPPDAACVFFPCDTVMYPFTAEILAVTIRNYLYAESHEVCECVGDFNGHYK